jgi:hypothetical protein
MGKVDLNASWKTSPNRPICNTTPHNLIAIPQKTQPNYTPPANYAKTSLPTQKLNQ